MGIAGGRRRVNIASIQATGGFIVAPGPFLRELLQDIPGILAWGQASVSKQIVGAVGSIYPKRAHGKLLGRARWAIDPQGDEEASVPLRGFNVKTSLGKARHHPATAIMLEAVLRPS